jgi:hypothetical protein
MKKSPRQPGWSRRFVAPTGRGNSTPEAVAMPRARILREVQVLFAPVKNLGRTEGLAENN